MRLLYSLLLTLAFPAYLFAQQKGASNQLPTQLKKILAETSNGFKSLKGDEIKGQDEDNTYASKITLQGTTENQIMDFDTGGSYMAKLGETTDAKKAQALLDLWKKKVVAIVGSSYEVTNDSQSNGESEQKGYLLLSDKVSISIHSIQYQGEDTINAFLLIMRL